MPTELYPSDPREAEETLKGSHIPSEYKILLIIDDLTSLGMGMPEAS